MPYSKKDLKLHIRECKRIIRLLNKFYNYPNSGSVFVAPLDELIDDYMAELKYYRLKLKEADNGRN